MYVAGTYQYVWYLMWNMHFLIPFLLFWGCSALLCSALPLLSFYCDVILLLLLRFYFILVLLSWVLHGMVLTWNEPSHLNSIDKVSIREVCYPLLSFNNNNKVNDDDDDDDGCLSPRVRVCFPCDWWKLTIFQLAYNYNWLILSSGESVESQTTDRPHWTLNWIEMCRRKNQQQGKKSASCSLSYVFLFLRRSQHTREKNEFA